MTICAVRRISRTLSSEPSGRRPPETGIVGGNAPNGKGIWGPIGSLKVQDLAPAGLISMAFAVSVATYVKRRYQPTANGTGRRPTETTTTPSMPPERSRHARGHSGNFCSTFKTDS